MGAELELQEMPESSQTGIRREGSSLESLTESDIAAPLNAQDTIEEKEASPLQDQKEPTVIEADGNPAPQEPYDKFAEPGRVRRMSTISNLMNALLGAGILGVPDAMKYCGIVPSVILLFIVAALSHVATVLTIKLQLRTEADGLDDLALKVLGKIGSVILSILSMLFCISCMVAYLIIAPDSVLSWLRLGGITLGSGWPRALLVLGYSIVIPAAMTIPRQVAFLSKFSWVNFFCIIYYVIVMIIKGSISLSKSGMAQGVIVSKMGFGFFSAYSVFGLAFALPVVVLPIVAPYNKDPKKRSNVSFWAMLLCFLCVAIPGVLGYLMKGSSVTDNILLSFADDDYLILSVRVGFFLVVSFSYPCVAQSLMASWSELIFHQNNQAQLPALKRSLVIFLTNVVPIGIAMVLPNARPALSVGGALGGSLVDFSFPALMWVIISKERWFHWQNILCIIFFAFGIASAGISTYLAILDAIASFA